MKKKRVVVNDCMQQGYVYYLTEPVGKNFDPDFKPQLTPREMLELGVFGGKYMTDCEDEFPRTWFKNAKLSPDGADPEVNLFGVSASQPLSEWRKKGWMRRHIAQVKKNCERYDFDCRPRQRQALLHWAYDPREI